MQGLATSDYRGYQQWPVSAEEEEEGYPLCVLNSYRPFLVLNALFQPARNEGAFTRELDLVRRKHAWWRSLQQLERGRPPQGGCSAELRARSAEYERRERQTLTLTWIYGCTIIWCSCKFFNMTLSALFS